MLEGESDREITMLRAFRRLTTLVRNAAFQKPVTELKFMPLPGDDDLLEEEKKGMVPPNVMLEMIAQTFGLKLIDNRKA